MDALPQRFAGLQKLMRLSDDEMEVLKVLWLMGIDKLEEVNVPFAMSPQSGCIALYTGLGEQQVRQSLRRCSRLSRFGCIERSGRSTIISTNIRYYLDGVDKNPLESVYYRQCELSGTDRQGEEMLRPSKDYSTEGLNIKSSIPLEKLEGAVRRFIDESARKADSDAPRMNILLTGLRHWSANWRQRAGDVLALVSMPEKSERGDTWTV